MKNVMMVGCNGKIGIALYAHLKKYYNFIMVDISENIMRYENYIQIDVTKIGDIDSIFNKQQVDAVINLVGMNETKPIPDPDIVEKMEECYFLSTYNLLFCIQKYGCKKFILASSNHVTDYYENDGYSNLEREINVRDYPLSKDIYGTLKLAAEGLCWNFYFNFNINFACIRIGTFRGDMNRPEHGRWSRTFWTAEDMAKTISMAIDAREIHDIFYGVSNNVNKPWNTDNVNKLFERGINE